MRRGYVISYDVCDPQRLRLVHRVLYGFGDPLQLSVFYCELTESELVILRSRIEEILDMKKDQVLLIDVGMNGEERLTTIGRKVKHSENRVIIV